MIAIRVDNLSKRYHIGGKQERYRTLRDTVTDAMAAPWRKAGRLTAWPGYSSSELARNPLAPKNVAFKATRGQVIA